MDYQLDFIQNLYFKFGIKSMYLGTTLDTDQKWNQTCFRAATVDFWQPLHQNATDAVYYFSKSSQGPSLVCLASRGDPVFLYLIKLKFWEFGQN